MKLYGSLDNRLMEDKMYADEITIGTGVTEFMWSDRHAYEVTAVQDQKHVTVREYDHKKAEGAGDYSNEWELISNPENPERELVRRGNFWYWTATVTADEVKDAEADVDLRIWLAMNGFELDKIRAKGRQTKYSRAHVSFGLAEYHYDYEF